ncbi:hypothetical protein HDU93_004820, partial [Gonapodya sp. JEL0774]
GWWPGDARKAGAAMALPDILSALLSPLLGLVLDKLTHLRFPILFLAMCLTFTAHLLFGWTKLSPFVGMVILGAGYTGASSVVWSTVPGLVGEGRIATAFGLLTVSLNASLSLLPLLVGHVRAADTSTWKNVEAVFCLLASIGVLCVGMVWWADVAITRKEALEADEEKEPLLNEDDVVGESSMETDEDRGRSRMRRTSGLAVPARRYAHRDHSADADAGIGGSVRVVRKIAISLPGVGGSVVAPETWYAPFLPCALILVTK